MRKRKIFSFVLIGMGAVLLSAALLLVVHNNLEDNSAKEASSEALSAIQETIDESEEEQSEPTELSVLSVDGYNYAGYIGVPDLDLQLPVMDSWTMDKLKKAPCLQYGTPMTNDAVIAGHNYRSHFGPLRNLTEGQTVTFTYISGYTIYYTVQEIKVVDPTSVYEVIDSEYDLVLYTCTTGGQTRLVIYCSRSE